jgi:hypothetical protein
MESHKFKPVLVWYSTLTLKQKLMRLAVKRKR